DGTDAALKTLPEQQRRRQQVENLHQRLRHQPGIAPQQRPFLVPQHAARGAAAETLPPTVLTDRDVRDAGCGYDVVAEITREQRNRKSEQREADAYDLHER